MLALQERPRYVTKREHGKVLSVSETRKQLLLTVRELSRLTGLSQRTLYKAEHRERISRISAFAILAVFNNLRRDYRLPKLTIDDLDWNVEPAQKQHKQEDDEHT